MPSSRACRYTALMTLFFISVQAICIYAKDAPEAALIREGRLYEAAQLLQKLSKDATAQRRSAGLYLQLALYERALERFVASGQTRQDAATIVVSEAFSQGNRTAALRLAAAEGLSSQAKAEFARRELAEGRARAALRFAREAGDDALIAAAGIAAYEEAVNAPPVLASYLSGSHRRVVFSPDSRFIVLRDDTGTRIEVQDTRQRADLPAKTRGRIVTTDFPVDALAMDRDGRFLALSGRTRDASGKETPSFRMERLDTGLVLRDFPQINKYPKGKTSVLVFANEMICAAVGGSLVVLDPISGEIKASVSVKEGISSIEYVEAKNILICVYSDATKLILNASNLQASKETYISSGKSPGRLGSVGAGMLFSAERGLFVYVPSSSLEDLRVEAEPGSANAKTGPLSKPLINGADLRYSGAIDAALSPDGSLLAILAREGVVLAPFPFLDREETAAILAKEFKQTERFAPLCSYLIDQDRLDEARRLWGLAGVEEATIFLMFAEAKLRRGDELEAAADFISAGRGDRALSIADALVDAAATLPELSKAYEDGAAIYAKAKESIERLADLSGKKAESLDAHEAAVKYYADAGSSDAVERLAFDPELASVQWCLFAGGKLGLQEADIYPRAARVLEDRKKYGEAATAFLWLKDDQGLARVAKTALAGSDWDYKLLEALRKRADPVMCRASAESLLSKGELVYAAEQFAAVADLAGVTRVADRAADTDDFVFAAELYSVLGTKSARATAAARLKLVYDELGVAFKDAESYLSQETVDGANAGRIPVLWPVPSAKAEETAYKQIKVFGEAIFVLPSVPRSAEAKRCAAYLSKEAVKQSRGDGSRESESYMSRATKYTFAARLLSAMGR